MWKVPHDKEIIMRSDLTRHQPFFLAAIFGTALAVLSHGSAMADEFRARDAIVKDLTPITGVENADRRAVDLDIRFKVNSVELTKAARRQLDALGAALKSEKLAGSRFEINGHTDASGAAAYNKTLSKKRALSVKSYLAGKLGIDPARLDTVGWGEERLKNPFDPKSAENRRVEIVNLTPLKSKTAPAMGSPEKGNKGPDGDKGFQSIN